MAQVLETSARYSDILARRADISVETGSGPMEGLEGAPAANLSDVEPVRGNKVSRPM